MAPGVHAGSGNPPWLVQPDVFVRGAGDQAIVDHCPELVPRVRQRCRSPRERLAWPSGTGSSVGAGCGGTAAAVGVQAVNTSPATRSSARVALNRMERIDITSGRPPSVDRPEGSRAVILTFDGLRNAKVRDKDTRVRITLQGPLAAQLWRLLGERLTDEEKALG